MMAHFAKINEENIVTDVVVVDESQEHRGEDFLANDLGFGGRWIQTSYNTKLGQHLNGGIPLRKNYACVGYIYDPIRDAFYQQQPYPSWVFDEDKCCWNSPIPAPISELVYDWNEETQSWVEVIFE